MMADDLNYDQIMDLINKRDDDEKKDRRSKKPDALSRMATILNLGAWSIMLAVWVVIDRAAPERGMMFTQTFFQATFGTDASATIRTRWDYSLIYMAYIMILFSLGACVVAFLLNLMRMKRKNDKFRKSIIIIGIITLIVFIFFMINFWRVLF